MLFMKCQTNGALQMSTENTKFSPNNWFAKMGNLVIRSSNAVFILKVQISSVVACDHDTKAVALS